MYIINTTLPILVLLLAGLAIKRYWIKDLSYWKCTNKLIYYIFFPVLMISDIGQANIKDINISFVVVLIVAVLFLSIVITVFRRSFKKRSIFVVFLQGAIRYNSYIFIGISTGVFGKRVMPIIAIITIVLVITTNIISVYALNADQPIKRNPIQSLISAFKNPLILSCLGGFFVNMMHAHGLNIFHFVILKNICSMISSASLPISFIAVGSCINLKVSGEHTSVAILCSGIKLVVLPALVVISLYYLGFPPMVVYVCMLYAGSPCSSNATAMTQSLGGDFETMSYIISIETLLAPITLSLWMYLVGPHLL